MLQLLILMVYGNVYVIVTAMEEMVEIVNHILSAQVAQYLILVHNHVNVHKVNNYTTDNVEIS